MSSPGDTIFAISTARGRAGVAVVRVSGPKARVILGRLCGRQFNPRHATFTALRDPETDELLDRGIVLWFPAPASFTGEDVAELQVHGSAAVLARLLQVLARVAGCRVADPGEFSRRAFLNGKLDLASVEGLADLLEAETEAQRRQAIAQSEGALARRIESWKQDLTKVLAHFETAIDFSEEEIPTELEGGAERRAGEVWGEMSAILQSAVNGEIIREGYSVTLVGPPNSGKSSLLNALVGRDVVITSSIAGTTRDVIEVRLNLAGVPVILADTAGLRHSHDIIEAEGIRRTRERMGSADLVLLVLDASDRSAAAPKLDEAGPRETLIVWNKCDLVDKPLPGGIAVSALHGDGIDTLLQEIERRVSTISSGEPALVSRIRQREALSDAMVCLEIGLGAPEIALKAAGIRGALSALGRIVGAVDVEDLLDVIFAEFCIGK